MSSSMSEIRWPNGQAARFFSSGNHLPGVVRDILSDGRPAHVSLAARGYTVIDPARKLAYFSVPVASDFFPAPASDFTVEPLRRPADFQAGRRANAVPVEELLWTAGFHSSLGRLDAHVAGEGGQGKLDVVVRMRRWPNLTRLPCTPNAMRICALLTRFPTSVALIPRLLSIDAEEVGQILSAACCAGFLQKGHAAENQAEVEEEAAPAAMRAAAGGRRHGLMRSLFQKIQGL